MTNTKVFPYCSQSVITTQRSRQFFDLERNDVCDTHRYPVGAVLFLCEIIFVSVDLYHSVLVTGARICSCGKSRGVCRRHLAAVPPERLRGVVMVAGRLHQQGLCEAVSFLQASSEGGVGWWCTKMRLLITLN